MNIIKNLIKNALCSGCVHRERRVGHINRIICTDFFPWQLYCVSAISPVTVISPLQPKHKCWSTRQQRRAGPIPRRRKNKGGSGGRVGEEKRRGQERRGGEWLMTTVKMMAKVVSEINWGLASRRLQGIEAPNRRRLALVRLCVCSDLGLYVLNAHTVWFTNTLWALAAVGKLNTTSPVTFDLNHK